MMTRIAVVHKVTWTAEEWLRLEALGEVRYCPSLPSSEEELLARIDDAQIVISATIVPFTSPVIERSPALRLLSIFSTGYNNVDLSAARRCGVTVTNVPGYSAHSVAEHAWAMVLHLAKRLGQADAHSRGLLNRAAFQAMAQRPILVNVARGDIVDWEALLEALESGHLRGVGLDVLWDEPPDWSSPGIKRLLAAENLLLSPHCGMHTDAAFRALTKQCIDNIEAFLKGNPTNVVSG